MILLNNYNGNNVAEKVGIAIALYLLRIALRAEERILRQRI